MLRRPCLDCGRLAKPGKSRCQLHERGYEARRTANRKATSTGAATRARIALRTMGYAHCAQCNRLLPAELLEVDHIKPLKKGGKDEDYNLQYLCLRDHREKSAGERKQK